ncbi:MAG: hypothetical protein WDW36_010110 [Sanguina aurantia]
MVFSVRLSWPVGAAPGIDVRRSVHPNLNAALNVEANVTVIDYSAAKFLIHPVLNNDSLEEFLQTPRPAWAKVRWVCCAGLSWDVLRLLALKYELHPLAVEDVVHQQHRVKADFFEHSIFICMSILDAKLNPETPGASAPRARRGTAGTGSAWERSGLPLFTRRGASIDETSASQTGIGGEGGMGSRPQWCGAARRMRLRLNGGSDAPVDVFRRQASMFLLHDGTLITIFLNAETQIVHPILAQLGQVGTLVRDSEDASFLANLLIDAIVDYHQPVVDAYTTVLERYESAVLDPALGRPVGRQTRELYLMQGPGKPGAKKLSSGRRRRLPGCVGAVPRLTSPGGPFRPHRVRDAPPATLAAWRASGVPPVSPPVWTQTSSGSQPQAPAAPSQGDLTAVKRAIAPAHSLVLSLLARAEDTNSSRVCFSRLSRTYLQDVLDHSSTLAEHVEDLTARSQELINLIFNLTSHHTNQATQTLSNISVVFLPITFIAGVYGTNFVNLPEKDWTYGYLYFWIACLAVTVAFVATLHRMGMMRV